MRSDILPNRIRRPHCSHIYFAAHLWNPCCLWLFCRFGRLKFWLSFCWLRARFGFDRLLLSFCLGGGIPFGEAVFATRQFVEHFVASEYPIDAALVIFRLAGLEVESTGRHGVVNLRYRRCPLIGSLALFKNHPDY